MPRPIMKCKICVLENSLQFCSSSPEEMRRHVAIVHCNGVFSQQRCGFCNKKFYDNTHFDQHLVDNQTCSPKHMIFEELSQSEALSFDCLVVQMMVKTAKMEPDVDGVSQERLSLSPNGASLCEDDDDVIVVKDSKRDPKNILVVDLASDDEQEGETGDSLKCDALYSPVDTVSTNLVSIESTPFSDVILPSTD